MVSLPGTTKNSRKQNITNNSMNSDSTSENSSKEHRRPKIYHKLHKNKLMCIMDYYEKNKYPKRLQIMELAQSLGEDPMKIKNHFKYMRRKELRLAKRMQSSCSGANVTVKGKSPNKISLGNSKKLFGENSTQFSEDIDKKEFITQGSRKSIDSIADDVSLESNAEIQSQNLFTDLETLLGDGLLSKIIDTNGYDLTLEKSEEWEEYKKTVAMISDQMRLLKEYDRLIINNQSLISTIVSEIEVVKEDNKQLVSVINDHLSKRLPSDEQMLQVHEDINMMCEERHQLDAVDICFNEDVFFPNESENIKFGDN